MLFEESVLIRDTLSGPEDLASHHDYDFIIATMPVLPQPNVPVVQVSCQLNNADILAVSSAIENVKKLRMKTMLEQKLKFLFYEDLFFFNPPFHTEQEIISFMTDCLECAGYVKAGFALQT